MRKRNFILSACLVVLILIFLSNLSIADRLDNWHWRNPLPQGNPLRGVVYGAGTFVAVGEAGTILASPDGVTWTQRASGTSNYLERVTYGNGTFVAVGEAGTILTSPDGVTWTRRASLRTNSFYGVTYGNGTFVAVGNTGIILTSPDGGDVVWPKTSRS
jgi:hypothetical protein